MCLQFLEKLNRRCKAKPINGYCIKHKPSEESNINEIESDNQSSNIATEEAMSPNSNSLELTSDNRSYVIAEKDSDSEKLIIKPDFVSSSIYQKDDKTKLVYNLTGIKLLIRTKISDKNYQFSWFKSKEDAIKFIDNQHDIKRECHEVFFHEETKFFLDIDLKIPIEEYKVLLDEFDGQDYLIGAIINLLETATRESLEYAGQLDESDFRDLEYAAIERCRRVDDDFYKISLHLISNLWIKLTESKALAESIKEYLHASNTEFNDSVLKLIIESVDSNPYARFKSLSLAGGWKDEYQNNVYSTFIIPQSSLFITELTDNEFQLDMSNYAIKSDVCYGEVSDNFMKTALSHVSSIPYWDDSAYDLNGRAPKGNMLIVGRMKSSTCPISKKTHDKDNTLLLIFNEKDNVAFYKCLHCKAGAKVFYCESKPKIEVKPVIMNTFEEDDFYYADLCNYFDNNVWDVNDPEPILYLKKNLHRVLAICNSNVIVKISKHQFFDVRKFKQFDTQLVHLKKEKNYQYVDLWSFINRNKKHFKTFNHILANYDFDCQDSNTFICSRRYIARQITDYQTKSLKILTDFVFTDLFSKNSEMFNYELDKLAIMCKYPHKKTGTITLLISKQGCGKNLYTGFLCDYLIGSYNCIDNCDGIEMLLQDKNAEQFGKKLIVVNEMSSTKDKFMSNFNKLKSMITETSQRIRFLYMNGFTAQQSTEYYALSNHKNSYVIEDEESRREFVPVVSEEHANNRKYWAPIRKAILNQDCGDAFYSYLMARDITYDDFMAKKVPDSTIKKEIVDNCKTDRQLFFEEYMEDIATQMKNDESSTIQVMSSQIYAIYRNWCDANGVHIESLKKAISTNMTTNGYKSRRTSKCVIYEFKLTDKQVQDAFARITE